jgi:hypothetical protein
MATLADDIVAKRLSVAPGLADLCERVRTSLATEGERATRFSFEFPELRPPAPVGWLEWTDGIVLGLWWRCRDEQSVDVCCFHRTVDGSAAMVCAITGYQLGSEKFEMTWSDVLKDEAHAIAVASDYLRWFAIASALIEQRKGSNDA